MELGEAAGVVVDADTETVGGLAVAECPAEGEAGAVVVGAGWLEDDQGALRDLELVGIEEGILAEGFVVDVLDEGGARVEALGVLVVAQQVGVAEGGGEGVGG